ncbi:uncharacterized protein LOC143459707 [Clavelina lepadiformis]|uniref:Death domain-containing protein n=1 Tax=Clavelina lepadiformis TaxID=159417 RepID=A0ABP0GYZ5_CLALP
MYSTIRKTVSKTKNGTYKTKDWHLDFERLPWVQWFDIDPLTKQQNQLFSLLYPILLQEINTKKPSSLLHFLVGKGVLFWQDVVIIETSRQTDLERNTPFLKIIATRGQAGYKGLIEGLRSRYGAWQAYLADMLEGKVSLVALRDMMDLYKIVCHDLIKIVPVGWTALPRVLGLTAKNIDKCRRHNKLQSNQVLHSLLMWTGQRTDTNQLLAQLLTGLRRINRQEIADGLIVLLNTIHGMQEAGGSMLAKGDEDTINDQYEQTEEASHLESGVSIATMMSEDSDNEEIFEIEPQRPILKNGRRNLKSVDSGFPSTPDSSRTLATPYTPTSSPTYSNRRAYSQPSTVRRSRSPDHRGKTPTLRKIYPEEISTTKIQSGKVYNYELTPRTVTNAWEKRKPSILQLDYMTHPNHDNMFMDYLVYH